MSGLSDEHARVLDSLAAYVLDALDDAETVRIRAHLEGCAACRDEMEDLRAVVDLLPAAAPAVVPPPELKARIMAEVEADAQLLRAAQGPRADRAEKPRRRSLLGDLALRPLALGLGCAALIAVAALGFVVGGSGKRDSPGASVASRTIPAQVEHARAPHGRAALVRHGDEVRLVVSSLPSPPPGRVYQVWLQRPNHGSPVPTDALFTVNAKGNGHVAVPGDLRGVKNVLVTDEPPGGSAVPSQLVPLISAPTS